MAETTAFSFEKLTSSDKAQGLSPSIYKDATKAFMTLEGDIRYRFDGGDPEASIGHLMRDGSYIILNGICQIQSFRFIQTGEYPAIISASYER